MLGQLTGDEFFAGVKNAVVAQAAPNLAIGKILKELVLGTRSLEAIPTEDFKEVYDLARENAGEIGGRKIHCCLRYGIGRGQINHGCWGSIVLDSVKCAETAVQQAQTEMTASGGFFVYGEHQKDLNGGDDPNRAVALVKIIEFCEKTSAVKLPQIEFLSDSSGAKTLIETARQGKRYGISARFQKGGADTHYSGLYNETKTLEYKSLRLMGWDIVTRPGIKEAELYWL